MTQGTTSHIQKVKNDFEKFLQTEQSRLVSDDLVRIDLHCHDRNSTVPDEILGRILGLPESWLPTDELIRRLDNAGAHLHTITNHNNARSCFELLDAGHDVIVGAEFTCVVPDLGIHIHVLTYGFTPAEEATLNERRHDLYDFLDFTNSRDLPTIWAHPLAFYAPNGNPSVDVFEKMALLFERFEGVNGQRATWQNLIVSHWVRGLTEQRLQDLGRKHRIRPDEFCRNPNKKSLSGGSDDHFGLFAGSSGTILDFTDLRARYPFAQPSELALRALRRGDFVPYGGYNDGEKLTVAFLDYFCQVAMRMEDPGLVRMALHQGSHTDKAIAFGIANLMHELRRHKNTYRFMQHFHESLHGQAPGILSRVFIPRPYQPILQRVRDLAKARDEPNQEHRNSTMAAAINSVFTDLAKLVASRTAQSLSKVSWPQGDHPRSLNEWIDALEIPTSLRQLFAAEGTEHRRSRYSMSSISLGEFVDALSFPSLACAVVTAAAFASAKTLFGKREFIDEFGARVGHMRPSRRALWVTDTFADNNGVSHFLRSLLTEIQKRDLPIDILICHDSISPEDHLLVTPPIASWIPPFYQQQSLRFPDLLQIQRIMAEGGYDRVVTSTEGIMGLTALYLKAAFSVPATSFVHTDWLTFLERNFNLQKSHLSRARRVLRTFYKNFDHLLMLNSEQAEQFTSHGMNIPREKIHMTAHWVDPVFCPRSVDRSVLFEGVRSQDPVLLYTGRLSDEKGVFSLPVLLRSARRINQRTQLVIAGTGPAEARLRLVLPDAIFLGWVEQDRLIDVYNAADLLLLPSDFDTFGCVVTEALACGLPVCALNSKGPRDILADQKAGYLADSIEGMAESVRWHLTHQDNWANLRQAAMARAAQFNVERILNDLMAHLELSPLSVGELKRSKVRPSPRPQVSRELTL